MAKGTTIIKKKAYLCRIKFEGKDNNLQFFIKSPSKQVVKVPMKVWIKRLGLMAEAFWIRLLQKGMAGCDWRDWTDFPMTHREMIWALAEGKLIKKVPKKGKVDPVKKSKKKVGKKSKMRG